MQNFLWGCTPPMQNAVSFSACLGGRESGIALKSMVLGTGESMGSWKHFGEHGLEGDTMGGGME